MKRVHLLEFMDMPWYPDALRRIQTDYLQFVTTRGAGHEDLVPLIIRALQQTGTDEIVDLCSGGTGPWLNLQQQLAETGHAVRVRLTDKYPHPNSARRWANIGDGGIEYLDQPVDATDVPPHLTGMRTMFEGFHHFRPTEAKAILHNAVACRAAIGIFEASLMAPLGPLILILSPLMTILGYIFTTPFIRPHTLARFFWTYLVPIVPLITSWDGVVSFLRVYSPDELGELVHGIEAKEYTWEMGVAPTGTPIFAFTYLVGCPN
jgi:hypothetical protein